MTFKVETSSQKALVQFRGQAICSAEVKSTIDSFMLQQATRTPENIEKVVSRNILKEGEAYMKTRDTNAVTRVKTWLKAYSNLGLLLFVFVNISFNLTFQVESSSMKALVQFRGQAICSAEVKSTIGGLLDKTGV